MSDEDATIGETYEPAMRIVDEAQAREYFEALVEQQIKRFGKSREETERMVRSNLGYFAGYYDHETRARVERLFQCEHPIFGAIAEKGPPTLEEAFARGLAFGRSRCGADD